MNRKRHAEFPNAGVFEEVMDAVYHIADRSGFPTAVVTILDGRSAVIRVTLFRFGAVDETTAQAPLGIGRSGIATLYRTIWIIDVVFPVVAFNLEGVSGKLNDTHVCLLIRYIGRIVLPRSRAS